MSRTADTIELNGGLFTGERRPVVALVAAFKSDSVSGPTADEGVARELARSRHVVTDLIGAESGNAQGSSQGEVMALWGVPVTERDGLTRATRAATLISEALGNRVAVAVGAGEAIVLKDRFGFVWSPILEMTRQLAERAECGVATVPTGDGMHLVAACREAWLGLDPLPASLRDALRALAVIGEPIDVNVVARLLGLSSRAASATLRDLEARGLVATAGRARRTVSLTIGLAPSLRSTVLDDDQHRLHRAVAIALGWSGDDAVGTPLPEAPTAARIAHHLERAGHFAAALVAWRRAAEAAGAAGDPAAAVDHLEAAVDLIAAAPDKIAATVRADIIRTAATSLGALRGNADPKVRVLYERGLAVIDGIDGVDGVNGVEDWLDPARFELIWGRGTHDVVRGHITEASAAAQSALAIATGLNQNDLLQVAHRFAGLVALMQGRLSVSREHYQEALDRGTAVPSADLLMRFASDQSALALVGLAWVEALAGHAQLSAEYAARATARAVELGHPHTELHVLCVLAVRAHLIGADADALAIATRARRLALERGFEYWASWAQIVAAAHEPSLAADEAACRIAEAIAAHAATGGRQFLPFATSLHADQLVRAGQPRLALAALDGVWDLVQPGKVELHLVPVLVARARAEAKLGANAPTGSATHAYRVARSQGAALFSCHAAGAVMAGSSGGDPAPWRSIARKLLT